MSLLILNVVVSGEVRTSQTCLKLEPSYRMRKLAPGSLSRDLSIALIGCHAVWRDRVTGMESEARQAAPEYTGGADSKERCSVRLGRISRDLSDFLWISVRYPIGGSAAVGPSESAVLRTSGISLAVLLPPSARGSGASGGERSRGQSWNILTASQSFPGAKEWER